AKRTPGPPNAAGHLLATDVDNTIDAFQTVAAGAATDNNSGSYGVSATGVWTFPLDNANAAVQGLNVGGTLSDSFTVLSEDGTARSEERRVGRTNDAAVMTGPSTDKVVEAGGVAKGTPGTPTETGDLVDRDRDHSTDGV